VATLLKSGTSSSMVPTGDGVMGPPPGGVSSSGSGAIHPSSSAHSSLLPLRQPHVIHQPQISGQRPCLLKIDFSPF
jgi:hypothetical protein